MLHLHDTHRLILRVPFPPRHAVVTGFEIGRREPLVKLVILLSQSLHELIPLRVVARNLPAESEKVPEGILNMVEMGFRAYDPCHACATHSLPGNMPLELNVYDSDGNLIRTLRRG